MFYDILWQLMPTSLRAQRLKKNPFPRLKLSISIENANLAWQFQSWPSEFPTKIGVWWVPLARLKFSMSLENFKILIFFNHWALRARTFYDDLEQRGGNSHKMSQIVVKRSWRLSLHVSVATPAERRGKHFFCATLLAVKQFLEKCRWNTLNGRRGAKNFSDTFRIVFRIFFFAFFFVGSFVLQTCRPN